MNRNLKGMVAGGLSRWVVALSFLALSVAPALPGLPPDAAAHGKKKKKVEALSEKGAGTMKPASTNPQGEKEKGHESEKSEGHSSDSK